MEKFCQSCGLPLTERTLGNEVNGSFSQDYCYLCYRNGNVTNPNLTLIEMIEKV